ncbi:MAG TPA: hypothetical protein VH592_14130 [Gemmataceae bacterium]|jgi:hypothetical protein
MKRYRYAAPGECERELREYAQSEYPRFPDRVGQPMHCDCCEQEITGSIFSVDASLFCESCFEKHMKQYVKEI